MKIGSGQSSSETFRRDDTCLSAQELSRIIEFLRRLRAPFYDKIPGARPDIYWNVIIELVDARLRCRPVDISALISLSGAAYGTGNRLIMKMIGSGLIVKIPRGPGLRTSFLEPSPELLNAFMDYASHVKAHLAETFGLRSGGDTREYYFGGSHFAAQIIAPLRGDSLNASVLRNVKFLLNDDNYFASMRNMLADFRTDIGRKSSFDLRVLPELYEQTKRALLDPSTKYDIIGINMPWLGEFAEAGQLEELDDVIQQTAINPGDFHPSVWDTGRWNGKQYGVPLYCTAEILAARADLFEEKGMPYPRTFDRTIEAARNFNDPKNGFYGIVWNGQRGMPIAHSFMFLLASAGGSVIDAPRVNSVWELRRVGKHPRLTINTERSLEVIDYMRRLVSVSPPDIAEIGWEQRIQYYMSGRAAMAYCWTMRAARFEYELGSKVKRRTAYLRPPVSSGHRRVAPIGGFLLTIPTYVSSERKRQIMGAITWLVSPEAMKAHVRNGFPVAPRFSVCADPEALASSPIVKFVDRMARNNELITWARPPIPQYTRIEVALGDEIHKAVFEGKDPSTALIDAENAVGREVALA